MAYQKLQPTQALAVILSDTVNPIDPSRAANWESITTTPTDANKLSAAIGPVSHSGSGKNLVLETGQNTSTVTDKLVDNVASFITNNVVVGAKVLNITTETNTTVVSVDTEIQLTLTTDIFQTVDDDYEILSVKTLVDKTANFTTVVVGDVIVNTDTNALTTVVSVVNSSTLTLTADIFGGTNAAYSIYSDSTFIGRVSKGDLVLNETTGTLTAVTAVAATQLTFASDVFPDAGVKFKAYGNVSQMNSNTEAFVVYVGGGDANADIKVTTAAGNEIVFSGFPKGGFLPVQCLRVWSGGTNSTNIVALW
jgi:hypothetical protein